RTVAGGHGGESGGGRGPRVRTLATMVPRLDRGGAAGRGGLDLQILERDTARSRALGLPRGLRIRRPVPELSLLSRSRPVGAHGLDNREPRPARPRDRALEGPAAACEGTPGHHRAARLP